jgi:thiamine phosphate synthase YjbQ (UPF0047 family)
MRATIELSTRERDELIDIDDRVRRVVEDSGVRAICAWCHRCSYDPGELGRECAH